MNKVTIEKITNPYNSFVKYIFRDGKGEEITTMEYYRKISDAEVIGSFKMLFGFIPQIRNANIVMAS